MNTTPMTRENRWSFPRKFGALLPFGLLAATFAIMAAISWYRWPDILIDYGRELYVPWRIGAGEMLYRDIPHLYGPLAHYFNALLFTLFGTSLRTLVSFNLLFIGLLSLGIYTIFRRACDRLTGTLCGMVFLGVFAFSRSGWLGNWNFVCPYSHEVTYGVGLSFLLILVLERFLERRTGAWAGVAGLLLGLIFLTKVEVFAAALLSTVVVVGRPVLRTRSLRDFGHGKLPAALAGFAAPLLFFVALFSARTTIGTAAGMVATTVASLGRAAIVKSSLDIRNSGLSAPAANIVLMLGVAAVYAVLFLGIVVLSKFVARRGGVRRNQLLLAATVLALGVFAFLFRDRVEWWIQSGRPFPIFVVLYLGHLLWRSVRGGGQDDDGGRTAPLVAVSAFGLFMLTTIMLNVRFQYYGFALAMPATLVVVAIVVHQLPECVRRRGGCAATAKVLATTLVFLFLALQAGMSWDAYRRINYPVGRGVDRFYTFDPAIMNNGPVMNEILEAIETTMPRDAGFVVVPEGVMLNYLSRRRNPGRWFEFTPPFVASMGEDRMITDLEAARPEYVVLTERPTPEHGARYFGTDFGLGLKAWIMDNYTPVYLAGNRLFSNQGFGIAIAKRNDKPR